MGFSFSQKIIIALDGASIKLAKMGILPDIILGDVDSLTWAMSLWGIKQSFEDISDRAQTSYRNASIL